MFFCFRKIQDDQGQATVEAALFIPILLILMLLLLQPGIILYNQMIMNAAASEGCRVLATKTELLGSMDDKCRDYILNRLGSIPPQDNFHLHRVGCSWEIELVGNETSEEVQVTIKNKLKLLPLLDQAGILLGLVNSEGVFEQVATMSMQTQPSWVAESEEGLDPSAWIEKRS